MMSHDAIYKRKNFSFLYGAKYFCWRTRFGPRGAICPRLIYSMWRWRFYCERPVPDVLLVLKPRNRKCFWRKQWRCQEWLKLRYIEMSKWCFISRWHRQLWSFFLSCVFLSWLGLEQRLLMKTVRKRITSTDNQSITFINCILFKMCKCMQESGTVQNKNDCMVYSGEMTSSPATVTSASIWS